MSRLPSFAALRALATFARAGNLRGAAGALGVTPSAIAHQLRELEREIGASLVVRAGRGLALTDAGAKLAQGVEAGLAAIEAASEAARRPDAVALRVALPPAFAQKLVFPRLPAFRAANPKLGLDPVLSSDLTSPAGLEAAQADVGVLFGDGSWPEVAARRIMTYRAAIVCRPGHLGVPPALSALSGATELVVRTDRPIRPPRSSRPPARTQARPPRAYWSRARRKRWSAPSRARASS